MKKYCFSIFAFVFLLLCPVSAQAGEQKLVKDSTFQVDARNVTQPVSIQSSRAGSASVSGSLSSGASSRMASTKQVNVIYKALKKYKTVVSVKGYGINRSNFQTILDKALEKDYYLLDSILVIDGASYLASSRSSNFTKVKFKYLYSKATMKKRYTRLKSTVASMKKSIGSNLSKEQIVLSVHDALIRRARYNNAYANKAMQNGNFTPSATQWSNHSAYGVLFNKKGVCSGYSYAYRIFMKEYGIPCVIADSASMNHAWNMVKLGGKWYHVDATWDDPDSGNLVQYEYCLLNNNEMFQAEHYGWTPYYTSNSKTYSSMPRDTSAFQLNQKGYWYFWQENADQTFRFVRSNLKGTSGSFKVIADSVTAYTVIKNRYYYVKNALSLYSMNRNGTAQRDLTSLTGLPSGTRFTFYNVSGSTIELMYLPLDGAEGNYAYSSFTVPD